MSVMNVNLSAGASGPSAALPQVAPEIRSLLTQIAEAPGLAEAERTALVQATATASSIVNPDLRAAALRQVSGMGLYLSKTGDSGLPRWTVLTALRAYGLNLQAAPKAATTQNSPEANAQVAQQVAKQVAAAGAARGVSVQQALQNTASTQAAVPVQSQIQAKNAAVVNLGGLGDGTGGGDAASLTTQLLSKLV
jgi:hypothetical protein